MRPWERRWFKLWEYRKYDTRPARITPIDSVFLWTAYLLAWTLARMAERRSRNF